MTVKGIELFQKGDQWVHTAYASWPVVQKLLCLPLSRQLIVNYRREVTGYEWCDRRAPHFEKYERFEQLTQF